MSRLMVTLLLSAMAAACGSVAPAWKDLEVASNGSVSRSVLDPDSDAAGRLADTGKDSGDLHDLAPQDRQPQDLVAEVPGDDQPAPADTDTGLDAPDVGETLDASLDIDPDACIPQCEDKSCGPDMCGGICGTCPNSKPVCSLGKCQKCSPACSEAECGPDGCGGVCGTCPTLFSCVSGFCKAPACGPYELLFVEQFTGCTQGGFQIVDFNGDDGVAWWPTEANVVSEPCSLYLGDPLTQTYQTNAAVHVLLVSPVVSIPQQGAWRLLFKLFAEAEPVPSPLYPYDYDVLFLHFVPEPAGDPVLLFSTKQIGNDTAGVFLDVAVQLAPVAGMTGRFRFDFDTIDSTDNDHVGFYLDDILIDAICPFCDPAKTSSCTDDDPCTSDACIAFVNDAAVGTCVYTPDPALPECSPDDGT
jgi:hypothetical protein